MRGTQHRRSSAPHTQKARPPPVHVGSAHDVSRGSGSAPAFPEPSPGSPGQPSRAELGRARHGPAAPAPPGARRRLRPVRAGRPADGGAAGAERLALQGPVSALQPGPLAAGGRPRAGTRGAPAAGAGVGAAGRLPAGRLRWGVHGAVRGRAELAEPLLPAARARRHAAVLGSDAAAQCQPAPSVSGLQRHAQPGLPVLVRHRHRPAGGALQLCRGPGHPPVPGRGHNSLLQRAHLGTGWPVGSVRAVAGPLCAVLPEAVLLPQEGGTRALPGQGEGAPAGTWL